LRIRPRTPAAAGGFGAMTGEDVRLGDLSHIGCRDSFRTDVGYANYSSRVRLRRHIGAARSAWEVAVAGLSFWEAARSGAPSVIHAPDLDRERAEAWSRAVHAAQRHLRASADGRLDDAQINWLVARTGDGADIDQLHGCLFGLDHANADMFVDAWRPAIDDEILLSAGDLLPVPDMLWPTLDRTALV
jgi:hypothetical protein